MFKISDSSENKNFSTVIVYRLEGEKVVTPPEREGTGVALMAQKQPKQSA